MLKILSIGRVNANRRTRVVAIVKVSASDRAAFGAQTPWTHLQLAAFSTNTEARRPRSLQHPLARRAISAANQPSPHHHLTTPPPTARARPSSAAASSSSSLLYHPVSVFPLRPPPSRHSLPAAHLSPPSTLPSAALKPHYVAHSRSSDTFGACSRDGDGTTQQHPLIFSIISALYLPLHLPLHLPLPVVPSALFVHF